ncbi:hypothetical protein TYRP_003575 [Tyrophagus putrescentiae]|nr:hypothetical protein TYRP_003575 [Tyrophagus putrescentiae]
MVLKAGRIAVATFSALSTKPNAGSSTLVRANRESSPPRTSLVISAMGRLSFSASKLNSRSSQPITCSVERAPRTSLALSHSLPFVRSSFEARQTARAISFTACILSSLVSAIFASESASKLWFFTVPGTVTGSASVGKGGRVIVRAIATAHLHPKVVVHHIGTVNEARVLRKQVTLHFRLLGRAVDCQQVGVALTKGMAHGRGFLERNLIYSKCFLSRNFFCEDER